MMLPRFGLPENAASFGALALGAATLVAGARVLRGARRSERWSVIALAALAALLSWGYVHHYLRGGPRIIDATSYWLSARALASGHVTWPAGEPETSSLGRFLVRSEDASGVRAGVLFPPGYPALLAVGFLLRAPLAVGPLLAAALVFATYFLAREGVRDLREGTEIPLVAAALSTANGALRYHTADTMSHGLAALCFTVAITCALRARSSLMGGGAVAGPARPARPRAWAALAGLFCGWLFATRPASALACAAVLLVAWLAPFARRKERAPRLQALRLVAAAILGAAPFVALFLLHQRLITGHWLMTAHAAAYATNDGPPGCFRYGFGEGVGCYGEHADFVRANLPGGFGAWAAIKTTARRLWMHLIDAGNAEPIAAFVIAGGALRGSW